MSVELAVALVALVVALGSLALCGWLWVRIGRLRTAQRVLLGGGRADLVDFAVSLQGRIDDLHRAVDEIAAGLSRVDRRMDGSLTNTAVVRYDAYAGTGGHQSASFAFLDSNRTGTVVTAIQAATTRASTSRSSTAAEPPSPSLRRSSKRSSAQWLDKAVSLVRSPGVAT